MTKKTKINEEISALIIDDELEEQASKFEEMTWDEHTDATILQAMTFLTRTTEDTSFKPNTMLLDQSDCPALHFLMNKLNLTKEETQLLTAITFYSIRHSRPCDWDDITLMYDEHPIYMMQMRPQIQHLIELGYLQQEEELVTGWRVPKEVMTSFQENKPFELQSLQSTDALMFIDKCNEYIHEGLHHDHNGAIKKAILRQMEIDRNLHITSVINKIAHKDQQLIYEIILFCAVLASDGDNYVSMRDMEMILEKRKVLNFSRYVMNGKHPLVKLGWILPYGQDGLADCEKWMFSRQAWMELLDDDVDMVNEIMRCNELHGRYLISHDTIPNCPLFYDKKTDEEVNRLRNILNDDNYKKICERLTSNNMPTGIAILLHGPAGTGKTELVQQLARETGRDLMKIDLSQIRDKYVGESEKNLTDLFNSYRTYCCRMKVKPILFINEADAVLGNRITNTDNVVSKMENALQNILLEQMEKLNGIMICTTNLTTNLDKAFDRRFLMKILLDKPSDKTRAKIWHSMLPSLSDSQSFELAKTYKFSGGQIQNIVRKQLINNIFVGSNNIDYDLIVKDCAAETLDRNNRTLIGF